MVDDDYRAVGLITVKDMEKAEAYPDAAKDDQGRLRVGAASTVGDAGYERSHGPDRRRRGRGGDRHRPRPFRPGRPRRSSRMKREINRVQIIAGNVATYDGAQRPDRRGRRRGQGRHRPRLDLHHPHRGRRGRAPADRHRRGRARGQGRRRAGHRRRRHQVLGRPGQGHRRRRLGGHDGLDVRRHRRGAGRGVPRTRAAPTRPIAAWARWAPWPHGSADRYFQKEVADA